MKKSSLFLICVCTTFILGSYAANAQKAAKPVIVNAGNYGLDTNDATDGIRKILAICKAKKATKLVIPKGTYHFYPLTATEKYFTVSNNDNGLKRIAFLLDGFKGFEIDARDATFIFHGKIVPLIIDHSVNVSINHLAIDWERPFHSEGEIIAVDSLNNTFDLKMAPAFPYEIWGNELLYKGEGWLQGLQENVFFDPGTGRIAYDDTRYVMDPWSPKLNYRYSARELRKGVVRILDTIAQSLPKVGWVFVTKGTKEPNRAVPAIVVQNTKGVNFAHIKIYHAGSMGFIIQKSADISLNHITVTTPPNSGRYLSLGSDATHFVNCKGYISIRNCRFENMHDDAVNIQGIYAIVERKVNKNTIAIRLKHPQQFGFPFAASGDILRLVDRETLMPKRNLKVSKYEKINEEYAEITVAEDVGSLVADMAVENISWYTDSVLIENCIVKNNRARSILVSTPGKVIIRQNFLSSEMAGIAIGGEAGFWAESGPVDDVLIEGNTFKDCCTSKLNQSVIQIAPSIKKLADTAFYHRNIRIVNNRLQAFDRKILFAESVKGIVFKNNVMEQTFTYKPFYTGKPSVELINCTGVILQGNDFTKFPAAEVKADDVSKTGIVISNNKGGLKLN